MVLGLTRHVCQVPESDDAGTARYAREGPQVQYDYEALVEPIEPTVSFVVLSPDVPPLPINEVVDGAEDAVDENVHFVTFY